VLARFYFSCFVDFSPLLFSSISSLFLVPAYLHLQLSGFARDVSRSIEKFVTSAKDVVMAVKYANNNITPLLQEIRTLGANTMRVISLMEANNARAAQEKVESSALFFQMSADGKVQ
jgi:hypothetical protein